MNIKKVAIFLLLIILCASVCGCGVIQTMKDLVSKDEEEDIEIVRSDNNDFEIATDENMRNTVLYYQNEDGYLVPVMRQIPWEEGIAKAALRNMIDSVAVREDIGNTGLMPIIPAGTEIIGMSINDGICKVDFTNGIMSCQTKQEEENLVKAVVYTLTEFPAISEVIFMVEGEFLQEMTNGTDVSSSFTREDINLLSATEEGQTKMVVYYKSTSNGEYEYYVPVTVPTMAPSANMLTALEKLFDGPPELSGLYSDIPANVKLEGIEVQEGIAYINLSKDAKDMINHQATFDAMTKNIALTLEQFDEIIGIEILVNGETLDQAGIDVYEPEVLPVFANEY